MKYKIITVAAVLGTLWHYAPPQFWPLLEVYAAAECVQLIATLLTK